MEHREHSLNERERKKRKERKKKDRKEKREVLRAEGRISKCFFYHIVQCWIMALVLNYMFTLIR